MTNTLLPDSFWILAAFFLLVSAICFCVCLFLIASVRRSFLISAGITGCLIIRYLGLRDIYYPVLLGSCMVAIDLYFRRT